MNRTIWSNYKLKNYLELNKDIKTEVLVVGGGMCGILCAYYLSKDFDVVLVEANRIASERTNKTTATITAVEDLSYSEIKRKKGFDYSKLYFEANIDAINEYSKLSKMYNFDFELVDSSKYTIDDENHIYKEFKLIKELGGNIELMNKYSLPLDIKAGFTLHNQAQMNPMLLINELSKSFKIYENTRIINISNNVAYTTRNKIEAKYIIICTGYPFQKLKGGFFCKLIQAKSFVITTNNPYSFRGNNIGTKSNDLYFRSYKDKLIIGSNDIKVGKEYNGFKSIIDFANNHNLDIGECWINQDTMSLDKMPYIGKLKNNLFVATGFNMWGMTKSMLSALLIRDLIKENKNKYEKLFSPYRNCELIPLIKNIFGAIKGMLKPTKKRCNHLGCGLKYNKQEKTYECSCHGSKYDKDGNLLNGPAQKNNRLCK